MSNSHFALEIVLRIGGETLARCQPSPGEFIIGSEPQSEILIDDLSVSPQHARLTMSGDEKFFIEDLGSENGTFIDGEPARGVAPVAPGSVISIGTATLAFEHGGLPAAVLAQFPPDFLRPQRYVLGDSIVQGSTSTIFEARDTAIGRHVAIKIMLAESQAQAGPALRFIREAQIAGQLQHPGVLPIYDLSLDPENRLFCATRFVEGETLAAILDAVAAGGSAHAEFANLSVLIALFQKLCDAVAYAHSRGVVHCALRPETITIGSFGEVFVNGWGLAKTLPLDEFIGTNVRALESSELPDLGRYSAPEQAEGALDEIDERTDVHALGGILFRLLTLRDPITAETESELLEQALSPRFAPAIVIAKSSPCPHWPGGRMPEALAAIAVKALSLAREDRHASVLEFQKDLALWQHGAESGKLWKQVTGLLGRR